MLKWWLTGAGIGKAGPFDSQVEAWKMTIGHNDVPVDGMIVWCTEETEDAGNTSGDPLRDDNVPPCDLPREIREPRTLMAQHD